jgi:aminopeptidase YwaD
MSPPGCGRQSRPGECPGNAGSDTPGPARDGSHAAASSRTRPGYASFVVLRNLAAAALLASSTPALAGSSLPGDVAARVSAVNIAAHIEALAALDRWTPAGKQAARDYVEAEFVRYGYTPFVDESGNVRAELVGATDSNALFVLGGHYDAVSGSPGADDNASGTAGMLEVARALSTAATTTSALFVAWADEELGYFGSEALAFELALAGTNVLGAVSLEMIAFTGNAQFQFGNVPGCFQVSSYENQATPDFIAAVGNQSGQILAYAGAATAWVPELHLEWAEVLDGDGQCLPDTRRSDHAAFWDQGWPALLVTDTANFRNPHYHQATDTPETLDLVFAARVTRTTAAYMAQAIGVTAVPEPGQAALTAVGALALAAAAGRRRLRPRSALAESTRRR